MSWRNTPRGRKRTPRFSERVAEDNEEAEKLSKRGAMEDGRKMALG